jgi:hypothetical protein
MRTTLELDDKVVKLAKEHLGPGTFRSIVEKALWEALRGKWRGDMLRLIDEGIELDITVEENKRLRQDNKEHDLAWRNRTDPI